MTQEERNMVKQIKYIVLNCAAGYYNKRTVEMFIKRSQTGSGALNYDAWSMDSGEILILCNMLLKKKKVENG